jgi:hypothetical protein
MKPCYTKSVCSVAHSRTRTLALSPLAVIPLRKLESAASVNRMLAGGGVALHPDLVLPSACPRSPPKPVEHED